MFDFFKKKHKENLENLDDGQIDEQVQEVQSDAQPIDKSYDVNNIESVGENGQTGETQPAGTVEKINLSDVNNLKAEMQFDEEIEKVTNDRQYLLECYRYLKSHKDELKQLLGVDEIKFEE